MDKAPDSSFTEFQLQRELELKRLEVEAETALKMHQLELQKRSKSVLLSVPGLLIPHLM